MRKAFLSLVAMMVAMSVNAQKYLNDSNTPFTEGKWYASAGLSGLDLSYNSTREWNFNINAKAGYMFEDNWMVLGEGMWGVYHGASNEFRLGAGVRYYIEQNGLYLGAGARYKHAFKCDDFLPNVNVGYAFFLSRTVTVEPELYYDMSTRSFKDNSGFGFRIGFGIYLDELF